MSQYDPPLVHLPGTKLTPEVVLHRTLNKTAHIKGVAVVIFWNDDTLAVDWSEMKASELALSALVLTDQAAKVTISQGRKD